MGQNLRKTPKTIRGFIIYLTISLKNSFLSDIEDRIHQTLIAYIFLTSDAYITFSASIVPVLISALHRPLNVKIDQESRNKVSKQSKHMVDLPFPIIFQSRGPQSSCEIIS
jgi:hypothetical protein